MKLAAYRWRGEAARSAILAGENILDIGVAAAALGKDDASAALLADPNTLVRRAATELALLSQIADLAHSPTDELRMMPLADVELVAPIPSPGKILCVGLNYHDHVIEVGLQVPRRPHVFAKLPNALSGPEDDIVYPSDVTDRVDYEVELTIVMGRRAKAVTPETALGHVLGYTVANDVSARDWQFDDDNQLTLGKGFDTFFPIGPSIVTGDEIDDARDLRIRCWVNEELRQDARTSAMVFGVADIVSVISTVCTLEPGDLIATGTPAGVGHGRRPPAYLRPGDSVVCEIEGIGQLRNRVIGRKENVA